MLRNSFFAAVSLLELLTTAISFKLRPLNLGQTRFSSISSINSKKSHWLPVGSTIQLKIDDLTNMGLGVGRIPRDDGSTWVVMVPKVIPGELVSVRITKNFKQHSIANLTAVIEASNDRTAPICKYYSECGGCQYQHMTIDAQLKWKRKQVGDVLSKIGGITNVSVNPTIGSDRSYHYRSKITPHLAYKDNRVVRVGFQREKSHDVVDVGQCVIATENINRKYRNLRYQLMKNAPKDKKVEQLLLREGGDGEVVASGAKSVTYAINNIFYTLHAGDFFQNNLYALPLLIQHVVRLATERDKPALPSSPSQQHNSSSDTTAAEERGGKPAKYRNFVDAYCGSGLFALQLAKHFHSVYGIEANDTAITSAAMNAHSNNITKVQFIRGQAELIFEAIQELDSNETVVLLDPPRSGCDDAFLQQLLVFSPAKIIYVSCDPATQARDAKLILQCGYSVEDITPVDMFPQTRHVESVVSFVKNS